MSKPDEKPLIVQSDKTLLLEVDNPYFEEARAKLARFAELEKSPEYLHTYKITNLSLWNAASIKLTVDSILETLYAYSKYPVPQTVIAEINRQINRYGKLKLKRDDNGDMIIESEEVNYIKEISKAKTIQSYIDGNRDAHSVYIKPMFRGHIKQALLKLGFPVEDIAGYDKGTDFDFELRPTTLSGREFVIRDYQRLAVDTFYDDGSVEGGSGVVVLPCGAGKTIVGIGAMKAVGAQTLILVTNTLSIRQWKNEILDKTTIEEKDIGEYSGDKKDIQAITIATYNIITHRKKKDGNFFHFHLFSAKKWGLIIYDEVHLLPAPVFRMTSELQAKRRIGLTATLVREDGLEEDVFSLIGPKKLDVPWKDLEKKEWIAEATCREVRIPMRALMRGMYAIADDREKFRLSSENPEKLRAIGTLIKYHEGCQILVIGQYVDQLERIAKRFNIPLITGKTPISERETLYTKFRSQEISVLVVSKVANFSIDLPDANIAIQVSGTFGSRQEEAQRLGRILRPKSKSGRKDAVFYSLITEETSEERFSHNRQLFLTEQGYEYIIFSYDQFKKEFNFNIAMMKNFENAPLPPRIITATK